MQKKHLSWHITANVGHIAYVTVISGFGLAKKSKSLDLIDKNASSRMDMGL